MNWPSAGEIEEAMDVLHRHPTPTDFVAVALNLSEAQVTKIRSCDLVLHLTDGRTVTVKGNDIL